jgi:tRNA (guanine-N7-)-methyltransferase
VRLYTDDARLLPERLAGGSLARIITLFPDPWPKKRHHKRRIVCPPMIARFADLLADGGEFRFATDHDELARWTLRHLMAEPRLRWLAERPRDWRERPADWPETRYEAKARAANIRPLFLRFERVPRA